MLSSQVVHQFFDKILSKEDKGIFLKYGIALVRRVLKFSFLIPVIAQFVSKQVYPISPEKNKKVNIRILVLNEERYRPDLAVLGKHPEVELLTLPSRIQHLLNAIWVSELRELSQNDPDAYIRNTDPRVTSVRLALTAFLKKLLSSLQKRLAFDALVTCTFYYRQDRDWETASLEAGIAFFVLHKENMKDPVTHEHVIKRYRRKHLNFAGTRVFLFNELEKTVLLKSNVCEADKISVVGGLRMDVIYDEVSRSDLPQPEKCVVLFSFHHCIGMVEIEGLDGFFSSDVDQGFVKLFDQVHAGVAKFAIDHPEVKVTIKPKWQHGWADQIKDAIHRVLNVDANEIENLTITADIPAHELIKKSSVVVGINSTTLFEAKLFGRRVVVPIFEEAKNKYFKEHVYFQEYLHEVFNVADSMEDMIGQIGRELAETAPQREMPDQMVKDYLGYFDGKVANRVVNQMKSDISAIQQS